MTPNFPESLHDEALRDIARNEANETLYRKAAVRILLQHKSRYADLEYLAPLVSEVKAEQEAEEEVRAIVETSAEEPLPESPEVEALKQKLMEAELELEAYRNPARPSAAPKTPDVLRASVRTDTL